MAICTADLFGFFSTAAHQSTAGNDVLLLLLQGFLTRTTSDMEASSSRVQTLPAFPGLPTVQEQGDSAQPRGDDEVSDFGDDQASLHLQVALGKSS